MGWAARLVPISCWKLRGTMVFLGFSSGSWLFTDRDLLVNCLGGVVRRVAESWRICNFRVFEIIVRRCL